MVFHHPQRLALVEGVEQRLAAPKQFQPEMCSLNMGTMNFALYPMAARIKDWRFDWEKSFLEGSDDLVFKNTPRDIAFVLREMGEVRGARFEFECYDISHLTMLKHFVDRGAVKAPLFIQSVFGLLGGNVRVEPTEEAKSAMYASFGAYDDLSYSAFGSSSGPAVPLEEYDYRGYNG